MRIGERVQKLCLHSGLSLHDLENAAGLEAGYLMRILEGKDVPSCEILGRLAAALEVPPVRLFYEEGENILTSKLTPRPTLEQLARDCAPTPFVTSPFRKSADCSIPAKFLVNAIFSGLHVRSHGT
jgi:transcriptional regulator with XRE-family HTH domain